MASFNGEDGSQMLVEVGPDIHICGICKQQYNSVDAFLAHKGKMCSKPSSHMSGPATVANIADTNSEFVFEETYQSCVQRSVRKLPVKGSKTPSKKIKPSLTSKRRCCYFSGCSFKTQYGQKDMERHLMTHTGEKPFECDVCQKRFSRRDKLSVHSRSHTGEKPHKCKYCPYAAADSSSLKKHLRIHYDERPFKCQICPYASRNSSQLTVHLRSHTGDAPFQCPQCEAKFKINSDLKRHIRIHSGEKPYICDFCDYRCAMKGNLKSHVKIKHGAENNFCCTHCDFQCTSRAALRQHARQHRPAQPLQCPECSYSCSNKGALKIHQRIHSEERPFKCDSCTFASKQRSNLVIHRKKFHSDRPEGAKGGEEPVKPISSRYRAKLDAARAYRCDSCDASFVREDSLRSHRKQHRDSLLLPREPLPLDNSPLPLASTYTEAHLKIIVGPTLGQEGGFQQAPVHPKGDPVFLSTAPMIQQVSLLTPVLPQTDLVPHMEHQTVLLTHLSPAPSDSLHQAFLQNTSQESGAAQAFIAACTDLEGLNAFIREGGTEVTVVTEGTPATPVAPTRPEDPGKLDGGASCDPGDDLVVPNLNIDSQGVIIHSLPLVVASPQQTPLEASVFSDPINPAGE